MTSAELLEGLEAGVVVRDLHFRAHGWLDDPPACLLADRRRLPDPGSAACD